mmetsp:Transcript_19818/g.27842  ORF Transcript_19818/g.27842 Transcript_19818/m.27842 type:complete len:85 (+) Transcript_19818:127-381(+)
MPLSHIFYLWVAIFVSVVVHELGHAMAAAAYRVRTRRFGAFVIMFCFPGAYVEIDDDHPSFRMLPPISKLKITAAGFDRAELVV